MRGVQWIPLLRILILLWGCLLGGNAVGYDQPAEEPTFECLPLVGWHGEGIELSPAPDGTLTGEVVRTTPRLLLEGWAINTDVYGFLEVRLAVDPPGGTAELFWRRAGEPFSPLASLPFSLSDQPGVQTYWLTLFSRELDWSGEVTGLCLDLTVPVPSRIVLAGARLCPPHALGPAEWPNCRVLHVLPMLRVFRPALPAVTRYYLDRRAWPGALPADISLHFDWAGPGGLPRSQGVRPVPAAELTTWPGHTINPRGRVGKSGTHTTDVRVDSGPLVGVTAHDAFRVAAEEELLYFAVPWRYLRGFSLIKANDGYHLFAANGEAGAYQRWQTRGNEETVLHARAPNLRGWKLEPDALRIGDATLPPYEAAKLGAPHVFRHAGTWHMVYVSTSPLLAQTIHLATSSDLARWHRCRPLWSPAGCAWADWAEERPSVCADPMVLEATGQFVLYYAALARSPQAGGVVAAATSSDLRNWYDAGPVLFTGTVPQAPFVVSRDGRYILLVEGGSHRAWQAQGPLGPFAPLDADLPADCRAFEVVRTGPLEILAGYTDDAYGNVVHFHRLIWRADGGPGYAPLRPEQVGS